MNLIEQNDSRESKKITRGKKKKSPSSNWIKLATQRMILGRIRSVLKKKFLRQKISSPAERESGEEEIEEERRRNETERIGTRNLDLRSLHQRENNTREEICWREFWGNFRGPSGLDTGRGGKEEGGFNKGGTRKVTFLYRYRTFEIVHALGRGVMSF